MNHAVAVEDIHALQVDNVADAEGNGAVPVDHPPVGVGTRSNGQETRIEMGVFHINADDDDEMTVDSDV